MVAMIASLAILPLLFLWKLLFTNRILVGLDAFNYFYPYHDFAATALGAGHLPLWNPHLFLGVPFLADSQAQLLYPPNWPLLWFSAPSALNLSIALHLVVAAIGTWLLARRALRLQASAAWVAATVFALGGYVGSQAEHPNQLAAASWLPWLLLGVSGAQRRPWCGVLLTAVTLALSFLAGHAQTTVISVAALALWVLGSWATAALERLTRPPGIAQERTDDGGRRTDGECHAETQRRQDARLGYVDARGHARGAAAITLGALLAVALAAAQLVPTAELSALSVRAAGLSYREAVSFSYDPRLWPRTLLPTFGSDTRVLSEFVAYVGFSGALLGLLGLLFAWRRPGGLAAVLLSASGLFLAPAVINPLYPLLWRLVPGFALFRAPARWLLLYALGSAILAGLGAGWLLAKSGTMPRSAWLRLGSGTLLAMAAAGLSLVVADLPARGVLTWWFLAVAGALALLVLPRFPVALRVPVLMLVVGGELLLASRALDYNKATAPEAYSALRPAPAHLLTMRPPAGQSRLLSLSDLTWD
ncbi:MAG TPA: hypothetical protein VER55_11565, partial [Ardenticatenaceae bacterium]|nr:hypothetical protein [Ardenticatenaceae bacterium]